MDQAKQGDTVKVHYTGKLTDGTVFDSSEGREPLEFTIGEGNVIPGFENAILGMLPGDVKTEHVPADQAYGPHRDDMVVEVRRSQFPDWVTPEVGQSLQLRSTDGMTMPVVVSEVSDDSVKLDANHPLAGHDLVFDIELLDIDQ